MRSKGDQRSTTGLVRRVLMSENQDSVVGVRAQRTIAAKEIKDRLQRLQARRCYCDQSNVQQLQQKRQSKEARVQL